VVFTRASQARGTALAKFFAETRRARQIAPRTGKADWATLSAATAANYQNVIIAAETSTRDRRRW
jgi:hypothetical protein